MFVNMSQKCPEKFDEIKNKETWDRIDIDNEKISPFKAFYKMAKKDNPEKYDEIMGLIKEKNLLEVLENIQSAFKDVKLDAEEYASFINNLIDKLNNYLCVIYGQAQPYVLYYHTIHEKLKDHKKQEIDIEIPIWLAKSKLSICDIPYSNYAIPSGIVRNKKLDNGNGMTISQL